MSMDTSSDSEDDSHLSLSSSSDDESEDDHLVEIGDEEYRQCRSQVDLNPYNYQAHANWIKAQERRFGRNSDAVNQARFEAHNLFPLPDLFWLDWLRSKKSIFDKQPTPESTDEQKQRVSEYIQEIHELVLLSQQDFRSVDIWVFFIEEVIRRYTEGTLTFLDVRGSFEEAADYCFRHFTESHKIWKLNIDFEKKILDTYQSLAKDGLIPQETLDEQEKFVRKLYFRRLSTPTTDLESTYNAYCSWENNTGQHVPNHIKKEVQKSKKAVAERQPFEEKIIPAEFHCYDNPDYSILPNWIDYIDWEIRKHSAPRSIALLERSIAMFSLSVDLWYRYCRFALEFLSKNDPTQALQICKRAIRNCAWSGKLWEYYLIAVELATPENFNSEFERALQSGIQTKEELYLIYRENIDFNWRKLDFFNIDQVDDTIENKLKEFRVSIGQAKKYFGDNRIEDIHCKVSAEGILYNRIIQGSAPDLNQDKEWERLIEKYSSQEYIWQQAIQSQLTCPPSNDTLDTEKVRNWFKSAFSKISGWPTYLGDQWIWFERIYGDIHSYLDATWRIERKQKQVMKQYANEQKKEEQKKENSIKNRKRKRENSSNTPKEEEPPQKKQKTQDKTTNEDKNNISTSTDNKSDINHKKQPRTDIKKKITSRKPEDRPVAKETKDAESVSSDLQNLRKGNMFAPRSLLTKAAGIRKDDKGDKSDDKPKEKIVPKSNADFRKLFSS